jgi:thiol peroxidase
MAKLKLHGNPINTTGSLPRIGTKAKDFVLTANDLSDHSLSDYAGKKILLNITTSILEICALSVRKFTAEAAR